MMISRRGPWWTVLGLLFGALAVLLLPVGQAGALGAPAVGSSLPAVAADIAPGTRDVAVCEAGRVVIRRLADHGPRCRSHASAVRPEVTRSPSWHRSTSRRQHRDSSALQTTAQIVGSIPLVEPLVGEHGAWYARLGVPPHATGRLVIASRAPPALN